MTFTYRLRDHAELMAGLIATDEKTPMAVFEGTKDGAPATSICPIAEFGEPAKLIVIYDPRG